MKILANLKRRAAGLKRDVYALYYAVRDPRVPWYVKAFGGLVVLYALSPIDLIPDFIPVFGYLDDLILIPLGIAITLEMIPAEVMAEARRQAADHLEQKQPKSKAGVVLVIAIWLMVLLLIWRLFRTD